MSDDEHILTATRDCTVCDGYGFKENGITESRPCGGCGATGTVHVYPPNVRGVVFALSWERMVLLAGIHAAVTQAQAEASVRGWSKTDAAMQALFRAAQTHGSKQDSGTGAK